MSLPVDVEFRLRAAARVLERAARHASDSELRQQLEKLAASLRAAAEGNLEALKSVEAAGARAKTVDEIVREVREWIWSSTRRVEAKSESDVMKKIMDPIEKFEEFLKQLDKLLEVLP